MKLSRFYEEGATYFVTSKTTHNFPYFQKPFFCDLWIHELFLCKKLKAFHLFAFCLNYDHFHLLLRPRKSNISQIMQAFKKNVSQDINKIINPESTSLNPPLPLRREIDEMIKAEQKSSFLPDFSLHPFYWQPSFYDHIIRNERDFDAHWNYTSYNFLHHGLPENWKYTSLHFPELLDLAEI